MSGKSKMGAGHKVLQNTLFAVSRLVSTAFIFLLLSRFLGPEEAGVYYIARRYQLIFGVIALWGLDELMIRETSPDHTKSKKYFINFLILRFFTGVFAIILLFGLVAISDYTADKKVFITILSLSILPDGINNLFYSLYLSREIFIVPTIHAITQAILRIIGVVVLLRSNTFFLNIAYLILITSVIGIFLNLILLILFVEQKKPTHTEHVKRFFSVFIANYDWNFQFHEWKRSFSFAFIRIFYAIGAYSDVLIMSIFLSDREVGYFGAANTIATVFLLVLHGYVDAIFPRMSRLIVTDSEAFWTLTMNSIRLVRMIFIPLLILTSFFAHLILNTIFSQEFAPSIGLFYLIMWGISIQFIDAPYATLMKTSRSQDKLTIILGVSILLNICSNFILVPKIGAYGVVLSRIISSLLIYLHNSIHVTITSKNTSWFSVFGNIILSSFVIGSIYIFQSMQYTWSIASIILFFYFGWMIITNKIDERSLLISNHQKNSVKF